MRKSYSPISWFGLALVVIGAVILLGKFHVLHIAFSTIIWPILMVLGLIGVGRGFTQNRRGKIFWNTVWFLYGLYFFLRSSDFLEIRTHLIVPATFLIFGIAFLMTYLNNVKDWFFLVPALLAGTVGTLFLLADLDYLSYWDVAESIRTYWPVVLILFGLVFLFRRKPADLGH